MEGNAQSMQITDDEDEKRKYINILKYLHGKSKREMYTKVIKGTFLIDFIFHRIYFL